MLGFFNGKLIQFPTHHILFDGLIKIFFLIRFYKTWTDKNFLLFYGFFCIVFFQ